MLAREVSVSLGAQMLAMHTGNAAGVRIQGDSNLPQAGTVIYQVETPDPYIGDVAGGLALVQQWPGYTNPNWPANATVVKIMFRYQDVSYPKIQVGDRILIGGTGPLRIVSDSQHPPPSPPALAATSTAAGCRVAF